MDSGRFESVSKPYAFHNVIKGMLVPLEMAAKARGLDVITSLDPQIDIVARTALYQAKGDSPEMIVKRLVTHGLDGEDEEAGLVVGDEHRLRQIITNLARSVKGIRGDNAFKTHTSPVTLANSPPLGARSTSGLNFWSLASALRNLLATTTQPLPRRQLASQNDNRRTLRWGLLVLPWIVKRLDSQEQG